MHRWRAKDHSNLRKDLHDLEIFSAWKFNKQGDSLLLTDDVTHKSLEVTNKVVFFLGLGVR